MASYIKEALKTSLVKQHIDRSVQHQVKSLFAHGDPRLLTRRVLSKGPSETYTEAALSNSDVARSILEFAGEYAASLASTNFKAAFDSLLREAQYCLLCMTENGDGFRPLLLQFRTRFVFSLRFVVDAARRSPFLTYTNSKATLLNALTQVFYHLEREVERIDEEDDVPLTENDKVIIAHRDETRADLVNILRYKVKCGPTHIPIGQAGGTPGSNGAAIS